MRPKKFTYMYFLKLWALAPREICRNKAINFVFIEINVYYKVWLEAKPYYEYPPLKFLGSVISINNYVYYSTSYNVFLQLYTSFWIVSFTLTLFECGSVQTNPASTRWTLFSPFSLLRQMASSSLDSRLQDTQPDGGWRYLGWREGSTDGKS